MPFRHDADVFRPNGVSRRNFDGMKTPNPRCFGVWVVIGKKVEAKNPNGVSAKRGRVCVFVLFVFYRRPLFPCLKLVFNFDRLLAYGVAIRAGYIDAARGWSSEVTSCGRSDLKVGAK
jgi:hypothetical protein